MHVSVWQGLCGMGIPGITFIYQWENLGKTYKGFGISENTFVAHCLEQYFLQSISTYT